MRNLKIVLLAFIILGGMSLATAQKRKVVKVYPKYRTVVTKIHNPRIVTHNKVNFHFSDGVWYKPQGKRFVVCAAPLGVRITHLPRGRKVIRLKNGRKVYKYRGIYYKKKGKGYVVINA